jgi:hypothetical protein
MIELAACSYLEDDVDVSCIIEAAIHFDDVGMIEKHLNFNLSNELVCYLLLMK